MDNNLEGQGKNFKSVPYKGIRKIIGERMRESSVSIPHVTYFCEINAKKLIMLRNRLNELVEMDGIKISMTGLIIKIAGIAIAKYPRLNSHLLEDRIEASDEINIGIAVALDEGLVVPVIKNVERKSIHEVNSTLEVLITKARSKKLTPEHFQGGTFTVSNLGMYCVETFTPIINPPETAILGIGCTVEKPVVIEGQILVRPMMPLSLSCDHRVIDGAPAAEFLGAIKSLMENPAKFIYE